MSERFGGVPVWALACAVLVVLAACAGAASRSAGSESSAGTMDVYADGVRSPVELASQVEMGRHIVITRDCGGCHGGGADPASEKWLAGLPGPEFEFKIGPCAVDPNATPCFLTRPRNLTSDNQTGLGRFSERQIFNALRFGLRPGETADVEITSTTPGVGNFPQNPKYLAPPMPWPAFRHMPDEELWAIAAYLKHGLQPVHHRVPDSEGPPDFWASAYTPEEIGLYPSPPFPTERERAPR